MPPSTKKTKAPAKVPVKVPAKVPAKVSKKTAPSVPKVKEEHPVKNEAAPSVRRLTAEGWNRRFRKPLEKKAVSATKKDEI